MDIPLFQVDAFTSEPFRGNPAGVCLLPEECSDEFMRSVAREMNLSETAFLRRIDDGFSLRWFTPKVEVSLCGHATLAAAHTLWETQQVPDGDAIRFHTMSGLLTAKRSGSWIELDFPAKVWEDTSLSDDVRLALGVSPKYVGWNGKTYLIEVDSEDTVRAMQPDFDMLKRAAARVIVTSLAVGSEYDFVSRFFAPTLGVNEDPVTGSAHCYLGPYWRRRLNRDQFLAYQASERGGYIRVRVVGERVLLSGQAVTFFRGSVVAPTGHQG